MIEFVFVLAGIISIVRLAMGPTFADRVIAGGAVMNIITVLIVWYSISSGLDFYLDVAIVMSLLSFTGTLAIAKYVRDKND